MTIHVRRIQSEVVDALGTFPDDHGIANPALNFGDRGNAPVTTPGGAEGRKKETDDEPDGFHRTRMEKSAINVGDGGSATVSLRPDAPAAGDPDRRGPGSSSATAARTRRAPRAAGSLSWL